MKTAQENVVVVERWMNALPERVYTALTKASEIERWFFTEAETDARAGGSYRLKWRSATDPKRDHERLGRYLELVPSRRVVFEWSGKGCDGLNNVSDTVVSITLTPERGGTLVRLEHTGWSATEDGRKSRDGHDKGWTFYMQNLAAWLAGEPDQRAAELGQRVKTA